MPKRATTIRSTLQVLICALIALWSSFGTVFAEECNSDSASYSSALGARCQEDPSCVVVGKTHMLEWKSPVPTNVIVVCIHGLGLCAKAYKPLAREFSKAGLDGFAVNVRGFGPDRDQKELEKLDCVETADDVRKLLVGIRREHPDSRVFLIGESMGGALAMRIGAENPELVDGVVCSAPAWKLLRMRRTAIKGVVEVFLFPGNKPGPAGRSVMRQATTDVALTQHWLTDPAHKLTLSLREASSFLSFISKTDDYAKQLTKPVLIVQGLNDHLVSPKSVAQLFRKIPSKNKTFLIDGKGEHLLLEEGQYTPTLVEHLIGWLKADDGFQTSLVEIKSVDDRDLSQAELRQLSVLREIAGRRVSE